MPTSLPTDGKEFMSWSWEQIEPIAQELADRPLNAQNINEWLADWSHLSDLLEERYSRHYVATTVNTADEEAQQNYNHFVETIFPNALAADQKLKEKLLANGFEPEGFEIPMRNMRAQAALFREANLPVLSEEAKLVTEYDKIVGKQTVEWDGQEVTLLQLQPMLQDPDRSIREKAWRMSAERRLLDRDELHKLWGKLLTVRRQLAENAGYSNYREYRWQELLRFDYTPEDCLSFHAAIEEAVVPAATRLYERRRKRLGLDSLRHWDIYVDPESRPPLHPFNEVAELSSKTKTVFDSVDPQLGQYFEIMRRDGMLDLENRKNKANGGYLTTFPVTKRPFIFMNAVGIHRDVQTLLHEGGHAFHAFEMAELPYSQQRQISAEFAEVASMSMELLAAPYLLASEGGFYSEEEAARARVEHLEENITFWPYMAAVDAFQHWIYTHPDEADEADALDETWVGLLHRFMPGLDWSGLEREMITIWRRQGHIYFSPFYYVEYGLAQLGAVQVWHNALNDQAKAVADYRKALALGYTRSVPELFAAAGAKFAFDAGTLREAVDLMERTVLELDPA